MTSSGVAVPLRWRAQGFKTGTVEMKLSLGGKLVYELGVAVTPASTPPR